MNGEPPDPAARPKEQRAPLPLLARIEPASGVSLVARVLRHQDPTAPVAVVLPAMGASARFYLPFVRALHKEGLTVVTADQRGHGESVPRVARGVRFGYRELLEEDLPALLETVRRELPDRPVILVGHSLGGQLALLYAATHPADVDAIALVASGSVWYRGFEGPRALRNLVAGQLFAALATAIGYWPGKRFRFGGTEATGVMRDWARQGRTGDYRPRGSTVDYERALRDLTHPVLAVGVAGDRLAPAGSRRHLLAKVPRCALEEWEYTSEAADGKPIDHFRWVRYHAGLCTRLARWVGESVKAGGTSTPDGPGTSTPDEPGTSLTDSPGTNPTDEHRRSTKDE
ncbi:alpha/beta fold hydrolase [Streptomyces sp. MNP-20]|uniref:alpha/beta hydrolase family protein n=1 Tax=Streptomyces sp. MNP-20 TaxID=2721165 RepID=UPI00155265DC|nr:alpha/beta fold hydrolase [Streptomyces sp. MNP-20]